MAPVAATHRSNLDNLTPRRSKMEDKNMNTPFVSLAFVRRYRRPGVPIIAAVHCCTCVNGSLGRAFRHCF